MALKKSAMGGKMEMESNTVPLIILGTATACLIPAAKEKYQTIIENDQPRKSIKKEMLTANNRS